MNERCYTADDVRAKLQLPARTFERLYKQGKLPFLEELEPRLGRRLRFRADLVDRYLNGEWGRQQLRAFPSARRRRA